MDKEKLTILKMLENGKITTESAATLLDAIKDGPHKVRSPKFIRFKVIGEDEKKQIFKINLPLSIAKLIYRLMPERVIDDMESQGFNIHEVFYDIDNMPPSVIANLQTDDGKKIIIELV